MPILRLQLGYSTQVLNKHSLCDLLVSDLVIVILGLFSGDLWLSATSIPSIVIGCLRSFIKSLILGLADTCIGILGGSRLHDWLKLSASFLLIYIRVIEIQKYIAFMKLSCFFTSTHTHTLSYITLLTTGGLSSGVISHPLTASSGNPNNFNVFSVSIFLLVCSSCSFDESVLVENRNGKLNSSQPNFDISFRIT